MTDRRDRVLVHFIVVFQVVILSRIIKDEEQAISSAAGIKLIAELLQTSKSNDILALAADCVARLTHTRAGKVKKMTNTLCYYFKMH